MEDAKIKDKIDIEELKAIASQILKIKKEDIVFAGIDFVFIEKHKKFETKIGIHIPEYDEKDYE